MKHPCWPGHVTVLQWIGALASSLLCHIWSPGQRSPAPGTSQASLPYPLSMLHPPQSADLSQAPRPVPQLSLVSPIHLVPNFPAWTRMCIPKATPAHCFHRTSSHPCQIQFWGWTQSTHLVLFPSLLCSHQIRTNKRSAHVQTSSQKHTQYERAK